jgi:acyl carrier protein
VVPGERLYRTGDLGRISEDGLMEYVGRTDNQVKVRGCRVETAEVEAIVSQHPSVRACAVVLRNDASGSPQLLAYVAAPHVSASELGSHVEKLLPRYMLPSAYIFVTDMPLTPSGKIDRSRLPAPRSSDFEARAVHASPESPLETELVTLWEEVLELDNVGRGDNFFSLGGNSLKAIQVIARLKGNFGVDIRVRDFFSSPTIGGLASVVEKMLLAYVTSLSDEEVEQRLGSPA